MALVRQVEVEPGGCAVCMAHGALHSAEVDARFAQMGGIGRAERMDADVAFADARPLDRFAERALDAAAAHGRGRGGPVLAIASRGGKEPGGVAMGCPGAAQEFQGVMRQGDLAVLGALAAVDVEHRARAIDIAHLQGKRFVQAQPPAVDGGKVDTIVQGGGGIEKTAPFFQAAESWEAVCGLGANEIACLPVAPKDVVRESSDATGADTHGTGREAIDIFSVQKGWLEFLFRDEVRRFAIELRQQADLSDIGLLRPFARATELQSGDHLLAQWCHDRPPLVR